MAKDKKSFLLYCDQQGVFNKLPDEIAGKLIKHIFAYVNDENPPCDDLLLTIAFEPIKTQLKRDLRKYDDYIDKQKFNGAKGGRPKKDETTQITQPFFPEPKKAVNVNVNVNDNEKDIHIYRKFNHLKLSIEDFDKLRIEYSQEQINNVLDSIENYKQNKSYSSLYLTAKNWLKRDVQKNVTETSDDRFYKNVMASIAKTEALKKGKNVN